MALFQHSQIHAEFIQKFLNVLLSSLKIFAHLSRNSANPALMATTDRKPNLLRCSFKIFRSSVPSHLQMPRVDESEYFTCSHIHRRFDTQHSELSTRTRRWTAGHVASIVYPKSIPKKGPKVSSILSFDHETSPRCSCCRLKYLEMPGPRLIEM